MIGDNVEDRIIEYQGRRIFSLYSPEQVRPICMRFLEENAVRGVDFTNPMDRAKNTLKLSFNETKLASLEVFLGFQPFKGYGGMCALTARCDN